MYMTPEFIKFLNSPIGIITPQNIISITTPFAYTVRVDDSEYIIVTYAIKKNNNNKIIFSIYDFIVCYEKKAME